MVVRLTRQDVGRFQEGLTVRDMADLTIGSSTLQDGVDEGVVDGLHDEPGVLLLVLRHGTFRIRMLQFLAYCSRSLRELRSIAISEACSVTIPLRASFSLVTAMSDASKVSNFTISAESLVFISLCISSIEKVVFVLSLGCFLALGGGVILWGKK